MFREQLKRNHTQPDVSMIRGIVVKQAFGGHVLGTNWIRGLYITQICEINRKLVYINASTKQHLMILSAYPACTEDKQGLWLTFWNAIWVATGKVSNLVWTEVTDGFVGRGRVGLQTQAA